MDPSFYALILGGHCFRNLSAVAILRYVILSDQTDERRRIQKGRITS
jgi:hypothetical protein